MSLSPTRAGIKLSGCIHRNGSKLNQSSSSTVNSVVNDENPRLSGLAFMLDEGTRKSHSMAQNTAFVTGFFRGLSTKDSYRELLTGLFFVYKEMECAFDDNNSPEFPWTVLDDSELRRYSSLERDLNYFYGDNWKNTIRPSPATKLYVSRINEIASDDDKKFLLVAHQYTRYLGDMFGGQMMSGMAQRSLSLDSGKGVAFYQFDGIPNVNSYIKAWYTKLNTLNFSDEQKAQIVDEANLVFDLNVQLLEELDGSPLKAMLMLAINSVKEKFANLLK